MFRHACAMGLEGIISKRADKPYRSGRCAHWLKVKNPAYEREQERLQARPLLGRSAAAARRGPVTGAGAARAGAGPRNGEVPGDAGALAWPCISLKRGRWGGASRVDLRAAPTLD